MEYSIVIPTYNHCEKYLKPCIESIAKWTDMDKVELIISANGCTDNTWEYLNYLATVLKFKLVWNKEPLGYPKAVNEGLKVATCNKIVLLNNDTVLLDQPKNSWLERLDGHDISGVLVNYSPETKQKFAVFFCVMIDRRVFSHVGLLNEEYGTGGGEDIEFCAEAEKAGFEVCEAVKNVFDGKQHVSIFPLYHKGEGTMFDPSLVKDWSNVFHKNTLRKLIKLFNRSLTQSTGLPPLPSRASVTESNALIDTGNTRVCSVPVSPKRLEQVWPP